MCNICGNQNLLLFWKAWPGGGLELCSKMQLAGYDYRCILICMFACWKKFCYAALTAKTFCKFCTIFRPQNGGWKMDPKMVPEFDPQNGSKNGTQKGGLIFFWFKKDLQEIKALFKILDLPFGCHFWTPFWGSNSGTIFGSIFQPPFWGRKMVQNLQKFLLSKLHSKTFSSK